MLDDLQALIAGINGLYEHNALYVHELKREVKRRELGLVCVYLREHPEVALPPGLEQELRGSAELNGLAEDMLSELTRLRATSSAAAGESLAGEGQM